MVVAQVTVRFRTSSEWPSISRIRSFASNVFLGVKDLTEHSEEVGNRKLRPKEWVLAKANHADTHGLGKIAPDDFAGRLNVTVSTIQVAQAE